MQLDRVLRRVIGICCVTGAMAPVRAQWVTTYETFYLQAPHNWVFRSDYQNADRLFNAFDYGHAILYETLWRKPQAAASELEERIYNRLTREVLVRPPKVPLEEMAIRTSSAVPKPSIRRLPTVEMCTSSPTTTVTRGARCSPSRSTSQPTRRNTS